MNNYIVLPSGKVIQTEDIIYISDIKISGGFLLMPIKACFKVIWANRVAETLTYDNMKMANRDREYIKAQLFNSHNTCEMICD